MSGENVTPAVIEPSFGIGRIIYALLEQSYWVRNPENPAVALTDAELRSKKASADKSQVELMRGVLSLSPLLAPTKGKKKNVSCTGFFCFSCEVQCG